MKIGSSNKSGAFLDLLKSIDDNIFYLSAKSSLKLLFTRQANPYKVDTPLLVISGLQRSGTHLADNLLRNHHQILSYYKELQIGRPNKYHWPDLTNVKNIKKRFAQLIPRNMAKHFLSSNRHEDFIFDFVYFKKIFMKLEKNNIRFNQRETLNNFFTAYFNAYLNCNHSNFYGEYKYIVAPIPGLSIYKESIEGFFADYPDGKIFVLIREPYLWWNSAQNHSHRLKAHGLERYQKTLINTKWACREYPHKVFAVSFDHLVKNTEQSTRAILKCAELDYNPISSYPSNFPHYAIDNSTFGHKKTKSVLKDKIKRDLNISEDDGMLIKDKILPLYEEVLNRFVVNRKGGEVSEH